MNPFPNVQPVGDNISDDCIPHFVFGISTRQNIARNTKKWNSCFYCFSIWLPSFKQINAEYCPVTIPANDDQRVAIVFNESTIVSIKNQATGFYFKFFVKIFPNNFCFQLMRCEYNMSNFQFFCLLTTSVKPQKKINSWRDEIFQIRLFYSKIHEYLTKPTSAFICFNCRNLLFTQHLFLEEPSKKHRNYQSAQEIKLTLKN